MTSFITGRQAETAAAEYLERAGYHIIERNYRSRWCEIDLIAQKDDTLLFVEVKYRRYDDQGGGLEYITARKLRQMSFAAEFWLANHVHTGNYQLAGIEVSGESFAVSEFIDCLT